VARALMGLSEACYIPRACLDRRLSSGADALAGDGLHMSGFTRGGARSIGGYVAEHYGWRAGFTGSEHSRGLCDGDSGVAAHVPLKGPAAKLKRRDGAHWSARTWAR